MRSTLTFAVAIALGLIVLPMDGQGQTPASRAAEAALKAAQHQEDVLGDVSGAIDVYKRLADGADRHVAAQALLRLAGCYEKLGRPEAVATYQRIVNGYDDVSDVVVVARRKLAAYESSSSSQSGSRSFTSTAIDLKYCCADAISPDGRLLLFARGVSADNPPDYWIYNRQTGRERLLLQNRGLILRHASFAPDSTRIAFVFTSDCALYGSPGFRGELVVANVVENAGAPTAVGFATDPYVYRPTPCLRIGRQPWPQSVAWSPDGRFVPFLGKTADAAKGDVRLLNVSTGESLRLDVEVENDPHFQWSPDGAELAVHVMSAAGGIDAIDIVSVATRQRRRVSVPVVPDRLTVLGRWTTRGEIVLRRVPVVPDQTQLVEMGLIELDSGRSRVSCTGTREYGSTAQTDVCVDISFDGSTQLIWKRASQRLIARDTRTNVERPLTFASGEEHRGLMSPDGRLVVFASNRDGRWGLFAAPANQASVARPVHIAALDELPQFFSVTWTRVGIAVRADLQESNIYRIHMNRATGRSVGQIERLTQDRPANWFAEPSPDGTRIAYVTRQNAKWPLAVMDADGSRERVMADDLSYTWDPPFWHAGDELLLVTSIRGAEDGRRAITSVNLTSAERRDVTILPASVGSLWDITRATKELVYVADGRTAMNGITGQVVFRARSLADGTERVLATLDVIGALHDFLVSPDGRKIVYLLNRQAGPKPGREIGILEVNSGAGPRVLVRPGFWESLAAWSPDSRYVLYGASQPRVLDTSNGQEWPLIDEASQRVPDGVNLTAPNQMFSPLHGRWAPGGSYIVVSLSSRRRTLDFWQGVTLDVVEKLIAQTDTRGRH